MNTVTAPVTDDMIEQLSSIRTFRVWLQAKGHKTNDLEDFEPTRTWLEALTRATMRAVAEAPFGGVSVQGARFESMADSQMQHAITRATKFLLETADMKDVSRYDSKELVRVLVELDCLTSAIRHGVRKQLMVDLSVIADRDIVDLIDLASVVAKATDKDQRPEWTAEETWPLEGLQP